MNSLNIRKAEELDSVEISKLIYITEKNPEKIWGKGTKNDILKRIEKLIINKNSRYYYKNIMVAQHKNIIIGAIVFLDSKNIFKMNLKTYLINMFLIKGITNKINFLKNTLLSLKVKEGEENSLYIANLATSSKSRGFGIGKKLLLEAEKIAKESNYSSCSLLAKDSSVKKFYLKQEYIYIGKVKYFSSYLYKMIKYF